MAFTIKATIASFGGTLYKLSHKSAATGTDMAVNLYLPPQATKPGQKVPVLFYLSGLTCSPENCSEKGFFQHGAARRGLAVVYPDTSPRGLGYPGEADAWDFGVAAGFYLNATQDPWARGYRMEEYVVDELPRVLFGDAEFGKHLDSARVSITGHSMGGHGALTLYLKYPGKYASVSAFAPVANPSKCPWGEKAFAGYLGPDKEEWKKHDATELVAGWKGGDLKALVDVGTGDNFYKQGQLLPENLEKAAKEAGVSGLQVRYQEVSVLPKFERIYQAGREGFGEGEKEERIWIGSGWASKLTYFPRATTTPTISWLPSATNTSIMPPSTSAYSNLFAAQRERRPMRHQKKKKKLQNKRKGRMNLEMRIGRISMRSRCDHVHFGG